MDVWQQRQQELLNGDDRPAFWLRTLYAQPENSRPAESSQQRTEFQPDVTMTDYAALRESLGIAGRGLDSDQIQGHGRMDAQLPPQLPGAEYIQAAQALQHDMGQDARAKYAERQQRAAEMLYGFRGR
ncbi:MAG: hypothetical protein JOZ48_20670 [Acidobacteriaceae bacterium]|nr:hypothetical protein [Streptosporangiaceae bacterium]MBV9767267.1 hypothetical protein [Acidobacteriaceae bacterium]